MPQVHEFTLPDLGEGLTEAEITRWLVEVGDVVAVDQPVVEVETAKAVVEVPCPYEGVVTARFGEVGQEVPVGSPLVTVASAPSAETGRGEPDAPAGREPEPAPGDSGSGNVLVGYGTSGAPRRRRRAVVPAATASAPADAAPASRPAPAAPAAPVARDGAAPGGAPLAVISPLVRRLARERGIDLHDVTGSGPRGLILRADVEQAARTARAPGDGAAPAAPEAPAAGAAAPGAPAAGAAAPGAPASRAAASEGERVPLRGVRGAVADKMTRSRREIPDATCWVDADATGLRDARHAMNAAGPPVSLLALLGRICTAALARFPELNATVDTAAREVVRLPGVHLGFAAQTDRGLVVPVVRDAHRLGAGELSAEMARLTEAARLGRLSPAGLTGGTFTLNNYGVFGVDGSTPIVNHPEAAMLGVGRIVPKPWVHQGELAVRHVVQLSLTFDHRVCDGGTAGGFLRYVADCVEQPAVLLRTL
ncbi:dihydrolipoamide acetyltransferase family protein [Streptomyces sp. TRM 70351]|uniref:dihydrolipoamide acetyltransferase family protein n=1 Tax=Streptomyces sp. TRM 70351 TaxID=3116552 RepID=UPI002E7B5533|nr:dihydrolipoamide acetyltransferase family protein [Streptomyces sp. TRM 70351]MEE1929916.1 dihydrolipoamide acetyltransferase family protein [Streptomyces sp. TRM 70351]